MAREQIPRPHSQKTRRREAAKAREEENACVGLHCGMGVSPMGRYSGSLSARPFIGCCCCLSPRSLTRRPRKQDNRLQLMIRTPADRRAGSEREPAGKFPSPPPPRPDRRRSPGVRVSPMVNVGRADSTGFAEWALLNSIRSGGLRLKVFRLVHSCSNLAVLSVVQFRARTTR